jgi:uncharacterized protein YjiS (DUF1127 family)
MSLRQVLILVDGVEARVAEWWDTFREVRAEARATRELKDVDDHLLRDMGLRWTGRRFERSNWDDTI